MRQLKPKYIAIFLLMIGFSSCQQKFNRSKWCNMNSSMDNTREQMLDDVLTNHLVKGKRFDDISYLVCGEGTCTVFPPDKPGFSINIVTEYSGIDPSYTKEVTVYLSKDSIIQRIEIQEHQAD